MPLPQRVQFNPAPKIAHEKICPPLLQNPACCPRPGHAAQGKAHPAQRPEPPAGCAAKSRSAVQVAGAVPVPDLPFLHQGAPGNQPPVAEHPAHRRPA